MSRSPLVLLLVLPVASCSPPGPPPAPGTARAAPSAGAEAPGVRPPEPPCLPGVREPELAALLDRAARHLDGAENQRALACAEEAVRLSPRDVAALDRRAAALAALSRTDEARAAYERALAVDPDDPEALLGAADLLVTRFGDRESLLTAVEHARRGARVAARPPHRDPDLAAQLWLVAAMAENDLGESRQALRHLDRVLAARPGDVDATYERGVALYELCRFREARVSLQAALRKAPADPWVIHELGLVAERLGDERRARELLARAATLDPAELGSGVDLDRAAFDEEVRRAVATLPEKDRRALRGVPVQVEELPALEDLEAVDPPLSPSILGLFRGPPEGEPCAPEDGRDCRAIVVYRRNLERFAQDRRQLSEQVRLTLLHELGHLHGETDPELQARGLE